MILPPNSAEIGPSFAILRDMLDYSQKAFYEESMRPHPDSKRYAQKAQAMLDHVLAAQKEAALKQAGAE